ncbi:MAG: hypothetical protein ACKVQC_07370 [Elusimicrobiota bacterium]
MKVNFLFQLTDERIKIIALTTLFFFSLCFSSCKPTYQKENFVDTIKFLAKKEYGIDVVDVKQTGQTLGLRFTLDNLLTDLASGDEKTSREINGLFVILVRVSISSDIPPKFVVLEIADKSNPDFRLVLTRYIEDVKKLFAEALSVTDSQDRLIQEFVMGEKHVPFEADEMALIRMMMMAVESNNKPNLNATFDLKDVSFELFIAGVAANQMRRLLKNRKEFKEELILRQVTASFDRDNVQNNNFKVFLDLVSQNTVSGTTKMIETTVLPYVGQQIHDLLKSYKFKDVKNIIVIDRNSGKSFNVAL